MTKKKQTQTEAGLVVHFTAAEISVITDSLSSVLEMWGNELQYIRHSEVGYEDAADQARAALLCAQVLVKLHPRQEEKPTKKQRKEG